MNNLIFLTGGVQSTTSLIFTFVVMGLMFYFMLIRPQKKQEQKHNALLSTLETGDSVLTSSGFYGVVIDVMDEVVIIEFGNNKNCRIPVKKAAIVEVEKPGTTETEKDK